MSLFAQFSVLPYRLFLSLYRMAISAAGEIGNEKAEKWIQGRQGLLERIEQDFKGNPQKTIWMHCASLGEFEQGRTLLEMLRKKYPDHRIVLTFFSPSGYEVRKNYPQADQVYYLPMDSPGNAKRFVAAIRPQLAIFIKSELWYYYLEALRQKEIPAILVSAIFRKSQPFFRWYGGLHQRMLRMMTHIFVQEAQSEDLLKSIGYSNVTQIPDTRIDRVAAVASHSPALPGIELFLQGEKVLIGGSIYREENDLLREAFYKGILGEKLILVPHEVSEKNLAALMAPWGNDAFRYSSSATDKAEKKVLFIDSVGMLSSLYQYGHAAFIGGGFGKGIHNILEPAAFGLPVVFGPNYKKFREAEMLIASGGAFSIKNAEEFESVISTLPSGDAHAFAGEQCMKFIQENTGGSAKVLDWIESNVNFI